MAGETAAGQDERREELVDELSEMGKTAVKVAASTVVATSLVSALQEPPRTDLMMLPEPTPIVQQYVALDEDPVDDEDETDEESESRLKRLLRMLKFLVLTLSLLGAIALGVLKGCAGIAAAPLLPDDEQQEQTSQSGHKQPTEDERGVAY